MHRKSALALHSDFLSGALSATEIATTFLNRIDKLNPQVGAFLTVYHEQVCAKAKALDEKRAAGKPLGKLAAVPIAIKDNIQIKGETTTCSSQFLTNYCAPYDATVIRLLEEEDALILGKTNLDEFAMGSSTEHSALQATKNPWNLSYVPGGSSGGSAAAVAARLCPIALGSDTGGSIRQPAAFCGILGVKPTYGRVSRYGLVAFASSLDQIGPFTRNAADAAFVMEVIGKQCDRDATSLPLSQEPYVKQLSTEIRGKKIGIAWDTLSSLEGEAKQQFDRAIEQLKQAGAEIVDLKLGILNEATAVYYILNSAEASTNLARFDGIRYGKRASDAHTLKEVYTHSKQQGFGKEVKRRILLGTYVLSAGYHDAFYTKAQKVRTLIIRSFKEAFAKCDCILSPTTPHHAFPMGAIQNPLEMYMQDLFTIPANLAGIPAISVPCGFSSSGLPYGIQFATPATKEADLLSMAHAYETINPQEEQIPPLFS